MPKEVSFSINSYDKDGYDYEKGIFLHFGDTRIRVAETIVDLQKLINERLPLILKDVEETFREY